jgi:type IV pilus assembly protein PilC
VTKFFYIARDKAGKKNTGFEDAPHEEDVISRLQAKDLIVISVIPEFQEAKGKIATEKVPEKKFKHQHYRITRSDLVLFCRQLATLLGAGATILKSLDIITKQVSSRRLYSVIKDLEKNMEQGFSFHESLAKNGEVFSELWVNLVESGEASGNLAMVLNRLATYLERNAAFRGKIISALIYPLLLSVLGLSALLFLTIKIVPTFAQIFKGFDIELPALTKLLIAISTAVRSYAFLGIIIGIVGFFVFRQYINTKEGRKNYEKLLFKLPVFGEFFRVLVVERFTSEMTTLVDSGVPILYSLEITEHSVSNLVLGDVIRKIKDEVREGRPLSQPLEKSGFFEPMAVQMIAIGEEIGELANMFKRLNAFYQEYVDTFLTRFTSLFEPIMLLFMGFIIGSMVVGMFLPIFQIAQIR